MPIGGKCESRTQPLLVVGVTRGRRRVWAIALGGSAQSAEIPRQVLIRNVRHNYKVRNRSTGDAIRFDYVIDEHSYLRGTAQGT